MEFKKIGELWTTIIDGETIELCACVNCKEVHGREENISLLFVDENMPCCDEPDNNECSDGIDEIIKDFVDSSQETEWQERLGCTEFVEDD